MDDAPPREDEPERVLEPRFDGVDTDRLAWMLGALDQKIDTTTEETDYLLHRDYLARAQLRFAAGFPAGDVHHDLLWSARCLRFREDLHFLKVPPERFRSRRIDPLEIGAAGGDPLLARQIAERYAVPLTTVLAGMAPDAVMREVRTVTRCFDGPARDALDLAGLGAIAWSAALGNVVRGFDDEARVAAGVFLQTVEDSPLGKRPEGPLLRYLELFDLLGAVVAGRAEEVTDALGALLVANEEALRATMSEEEWERPPVTPRYFDVSAVALAALLALRGLRPDTTRLEASAPCYAALLAVEEVAPAGDV